MTEVPIDVFRAIADTKARYCRCLDEKDWDGFADVFTEDVTLDATASGGGAASGRDRLVAMVRASIETARTAHQVHQPEMARVDDDTVDVIWAMQDRVVWGEDRVAVAGKRSLTGYGHYRERYRRCGDGRWRIATTRLTRLHIDFEAL